MRAFIEDTAVRLVVESMNGKVLEAKTQAPPRPYWVAVTAAELWDEVQRQVKARGG